MNNYRQTFGIFFLRTLLGLIFFFQGLGKIARWGFENLYENAFQPLEQFFPKWWLLGTLYGTTFAELLGGAMLLLGWQRRWALTVLGVVLLVVSVGHGLESPVWNLSHVFPRAVLLAAVLLLPAEWDRWSVDQWLKRRQ
jgi:putative oxidoreductase